MSVMVEIDDEAFYKAMVCEMKDTIVCFEEDLASDSPNVFIFGDDVKDKAMIKAHIDALNLLIKWYEQ